jgi:hypothetical protein
MNPKGEPQLMNDKAATRRFAVAVATLLAAAACAPVNATATGPQSNVEVIQQAIKDARAGGASEHQIEILEHALGVGEVTYDDLDSLLGDLEACYDAAGLTYNVLPAWEVSPNSGIFLPDYQIRVPADDEGEVYLVAEKCEFENLLYAEGAYMSQPAVVHANNGAWDTPAVRACLSERGYTVDEDVTLAEIQALMAQDSIDHGQDPGYRLCGT